jgi:hypothetical protein
LGEFGLIVTYTGVKAGWRHTGGYRCKVHHGNAGKPTR